MCSSNELTDIKLAHPEQALLPQENFLVRVTVKHDTGLQSHSFDGHHGCCICVQKVAQCKHSGRFFVGYSTARGKGSDICLRDPFGSDVCALCPCKMLMTT